MSDELEGLIWLSQFLWKGLPSFYFKKILFTYMNGRAVYVEVREELILHVVFSWKSQMIVPYVLNWFISFNVVFFSRKGLPSSFLHPLFHGVSSKVDKDFSIRHSANIFDLWGFKADHKG